MLPRSLHTSHRLRSSLAAGAVLVLFLAPTASFAQPPSENDAVVEDGPMDEARTLFERGTEALRTGRFDDARRHLARSLEQLPRAATAFNLAVALRGLGQNRAAVEVFDALMEGRYGELSAAERSSVTQLRAEAQARVSRLIVHVDGVDRAALRIDGTPAGAVLRGRPASRELDSGRHVLAAVATGREPVERVVDLAPGAEHRVSLVFAPAPAIAESEGGGSVLKWILLAAAGLALVGGLTLAVVVATSDASMPETDDVFGITHTLTP